MTNYPTQQVGIIAKQLRISPVVENPNNQRYISLYIFNSFLFFSKYISRRLQITSLTPKNQPFIYR